MTGFFYRNLKRTYPIIDRGQGVWVYDKDGNEYLDGCSGAVVANIGHGLDEVNEAIQKQLGQIAYAHTSQFVSQVGLDLADKIIAQAPQNFRNGGRVYFVSGGSEAVDTAIKMARSYFVETGESQKRIVISRWNSYHGSTLGAMTVTGHPARRKPYLSLFRDNPHINAVYLYRCLCGYAGPGSCSNADCSLARADELEKTILEFGAENVMAFIGEPVVGAALGAAVPGDNYWRRIREICTKHNVLLIADEVMTGFGRLGKTFGLDLWNVEPDIIVAGKGLAAGYMPLGAVLASAKVAEAFANGSGIFEHGFTYNAHPVACAAGNAAVSYLFGNKLVDKVSKQEKSFFAQLQELLNFDIVGDVRGRGFLAGIEFVKNQKSKEPFAPDLKISQLLTREALKVGLLIYPGSGFLPGACGDHVIIAPPFTITDAEISELGKRLKIAIEATMHSVATNKI